jgi:hypothetical protein
MACKIYPISGIFHTNFEGESASLISFPAEQEFNFNKQNVGSFKLLLVYLPQKVELSKEGV